MGSRPICEPIVRKRWYPNEAGGIALNELGITFPESGNEVDIAEDHRVGDRQPGTKGEGATKNAMSRNLKGCARGQRRIRITRADAEPPIRPIEVSPQ
jgi:hypothetical protein